MYKVLSTSLQTKQKPEDAASDSKIENDSQIIF